MTAEIHKLTVSLSQLLQCLPHARPPDNREPAEGIAATLWEAPSNIGKRIQHPLPYYSFDLA